MLLILKKASFHVLQNLLAFFSLSLFTLLFLRFLYPYFNTGIFFNFLLIWDLIFCLLYITQAVLRTKNFPSRTKTVTFWLAFDLACAIPWLVNPHQALLFPLLRLFGICRIFFIPETQDYFEPFLKETYKLLMVGLLVISLALSAAMMVYSYEGISPNSLIHSPKEALWWALVTMTTVGYGDAVPISEEGRIVAGFLMASGIGVFGLVASLVTQPFIRALQRRQEEQQQNLSRQLSSRLLEVSGQMVRLQEENHELISAIDILMEHQEKINTMLSKLDQVTGQQDYLLANMARLIENISSPEINYPKTTTTSTPEEPDNAKPVELPQEDLLEEYIQEAALRR